MSLVGTRPPTVDEWEQYEFHHRSRMSIKPGITGMWQVSGRSDITDFEEVVKLDTEYIENALKTNPNLYFAVLTGCLRISKESIFTGLNNLKVLTLTDVRFDEYFGFTDTEVKGMLEYYGLSGHYAEVKEWYDGYRFGNVEVYCPWDVINYCDLLRADPNALPQDYWSNTSGNAMVRRFIDKADTQTRDEIERLIAGDEILKEIHQELTYNELDSSIEVMLG